MATSLELSAADVVQVEDLCASPRQILPLVPDEERLLVLAIHRDRADLGAIQSAVRQIGFDPLGVGIVDLGAMTGAKQATLACQASIARMSHYPGAVPKQMKLRPSERKTRRAFLSIGAPTYVGAPLIDSSSCVASDGCKACVSECPVDALSWTGGSVEYDINTCFACGICVTTCPTGAIRNPSLDPVGIEAEIKTVVANSLDPIGIRFRCRDSVVPGESGWHLVEVPCTGMLTVGWMLAPILLGASRIEAIPCDQGGCRLGNNERLNATMSDARRALETLSADVDNLAVTLDSSSGSGLFAHRSTSRVLAATASTWNSSSLTFDTADVGLIRIKPSTCTACEMCAQVCPTNALVSSVDDSGVHISFDPQVCVACGQCVSACPEAAHEAITLTRRFDEAEWRTGRREVRHEPTPACEICGQPVAPLAMLSRIEEMLGQEAAGTMALIQRRCVSCRGR